MPKVIPEWYSPWRLPAFPDKLNPRTGFLEVVGGRNYSLTQPWLFPFLSLTKCFLKLPSIILLLLGSSGTSVKLIFQTESLAPQNPCFALSLKQLEFSE